MIQNFLGWLHAYKTHPIGPGATLTDYALSLAFLVLALYLLVRVASDIKKHVGV